MATHVRAEWRQIELCQSPAQLHGVPGPGRPGRSAPPTPVVHTVTEPPAAGMRADVDLSDERPVARLLYRAYRQCCGRAIVASPRCGRLGRDDRCDLLHSDDLAVADQYAGGIDGAGLVVLVDPEDDEPANSVRERCDISSQLPLIAIAGSLEIALKVEIDRFADIATGQRGDPCVPSGVDTRAEDRLEARGPEYSHRPHPRRDRRVARA